MKQRLNEYNRKRHFDKTTEPAGSAKAKSSSKLVFVVQKHDASHLHYDFRLEMDGVLKSWAIPKGPSLNHKDKRLAMMTEDHPYDYRKFEGVIPEGNYGAGEVIVWDAGTYQPAKASKDQEKELLRELKDGQLSIVLEGEKLKGEFALVRSKQMGDNAWLLIKKDDNYNRSANILKEDKSVLSGQTISGLKAGKGAIDLGQFDPSPYPRAVKPMLATLTDAPFDNDDWLFEIKWDGYRAVGGWDKKKVQLYSRNGTNFADKYKPIAEALRLLPESAVIDGEVVVVDAAGKSNFTWLQNYLKDDSHGTLVYYAFDLLWCAGKDLTDLPLIERKALLQQLLKGSGTIKYSDHVVGQGKQFFDRVAKMGLEGMMAKDKNSRYLKGRRSKQWLKVKTHHRQEIVIGGFTEPKGSRKYIGALLSGAYEGKKLLYTGHVGGGIPPKQLPDLRKTLDSIERKTSPFASKFKPNGKVHWVEPKLMCEVSFAEWTADGHLRQPIFVGLRTDKDPRSVKREEAVISAKGKDESK